MTEKVINNICESLDRKARRVTILYAEPMGHDIIMRTGRFALEKTLCGDYAGAAYHTYLYRSHGTESLA